MKKGGDIQDTEMRIVSRIFTQSLLVLANSHHKKIELFSTITNNTITGLQTSLAMGVLTGE